MSQRRLASLLETSVDLVTGYGIAVWATPNIVGPMFDLELSYIDGVGMTAVYASLSFIRRYWIRRFFNWVMLRGDF